jgi:5'-phosphate synthase pdxT subunit
MTSFPHTLPLDLFLTIGRTQRRPTWGTCAGLILLSASANRTKATGQSLIGGLSVRVNRNHFGRQTESFQADLHLPFLSPPPQSASTLDKLRMEGGLAENAPFRAVFIRAPIVEALLPLTDPAHRDDILAAEAHMPDTVVAPPTPVSPSAPSSLSSNSNPNHEVEVLARLHGRTEAIGDEAVKARLDKEIGDIVAVRQGNVFGCSFHPELTGDARIHAWWLEQVIQQVERDKDNDKTQDDGSKDGKKGAGCLAN